jgi:hypothetical protein
MATIPSLPFTGSQLHTALTAVNSEVGGKADTSHTHTVSQLTDINTADKLLMSAAERAKLATVATNADVSPVASVVGLTGAVSKAALLAALNAEDGATADQSGSEIATLLDTLLGTSAWRTAAVASVGGQTGAVAVSALRGGVRTVTESTALVAGDNNGTVLANGTLTITAPAGLTAPFSVKVRNIGSGTVTFAAGGGATLSKIAAQALTCATANAVVVISADTANTFFADGGLDAAS